MVKMEISHITGNSIKIKGKHATLLIDPQDKNTYNAAILFTKTANQVKLLEDVLVIKGPGEYEAGGIKIKGTRSPADEIYSITVDGVLILLGHINALDKLQHKLQEHNIVLVYCGDMVTSASFLTALASSAVLFYGDKATEISQAFGNEKTTQMQKYSTTVDKLSSEMETILLA